MSKTTIDEVTTIPPMLGSNLKLWIETNNLTRNQGAKLLGISPRQLRNCLMEEALDKPIKRATQFACYYVTIKLNYLMRKRADEAMEA